MKNTNRLRVVKENQSQYQGDYVKSFILEHSPIDLEKFQLSHMMLSQARFPSSVWISYQNKTDPSNFIEAEIDLANGQVISLEIFNQTQSQAA